jgi:predicted RNase H-like nuclease
MTTVNRKGTMNAPTRSTRPVGVGMDGCKVGWFTIAWDGTPHGFTWRVLSAFEQVFEFVPAPKIVAVDIPIGLLDQAVPGGRECDRTARRILRGRASCVFSPPVRTALTAESYHMALNANRASSSHGLGISAQCFGIVPKIREVDFAITPATQDTVREIHPELCFHAMNGGTPVASSKSKPEGRIARQRLLVDNGFACFLAGLAGTHIPGVGQDDIFDACAAVWTARRILDNMAVQIPISPATDSRGFRMEIWY